MPRATLERLGVPVERTPPSETADGRIIPVDVGQTIIRLQGLEFHTQVIFAEPGEPSLLGTVTLEEAALTLDPVAERLIGPSALPTTPCFTPSALSTLTPGTASRRTQPPPKLGPIPTGRCATVPQLKAQPILIQLDPRRAAPGQRVHQPEDRPRNSGSRVPGGGVKESV